MKFVFVILSLLSICAWSKIPLNVPVKYLDENSTQPAPTESPFPTSYILFDNFVDAKQAEWKACHQQQNLHFESGQKESLKYFLETTDYLSNLAEMDANKLTQGSAAIDPWSGDYWAYARGLLGFRFQDLQFLKNYDWITRYQYVLKNTAQLQIENQGLAGVNFLSPSEKYDLIVGDDEFGLTKSMWEKGKAYYDASGTVEGWMGICHGWASAAITVPRPTKSVQIFSPEQKWSVSFNPSEIKGLVSYSWATNPYLARSFGARCNVKNPERDENGRIIDPGCFDLNPADWHIAMVRILGQMKRSLVMDATFDYEVWNQPIKSYKYSYYNLNTGSDESDLKVALLEREKITKDPFAKYRDQKTASIVGVRMQVAYVVESSPNSKMTDSPENDVIRWVTYSYDLEMDKDGQIVGGEWHTTAHPDFIWTPFSKAKPNSYYDAKLMNSKWDDSKPLPPDWINAAHAASAKGVILNHITENILLKSAR